MPDLREPPSESLRDLLVALHVGVIVQDLDGRVAWVNRRAAELLGSNAGELCGRPLLVQGWRRDGTSLAEHEMPFALALARGTAQRGVEFGVWCAGESMRWLSADAELSPDGKRVVTTLMDHTAAVAREQQAERAQILQQATLDYAGYAIIAADVAGLVKIFNPASERILGYRADEIVDRCTPAVWHDREEVGARAKELGIEPGFEVFVAGARAGIPETREWTYIRKDGGRVPVLLTVTALRDVHGCIFGFMGIAQDISQRRAMEQQLVNELAQRTIMQNRIRRLLESLPDLVFCVDDSGVFRYVHTPSPGLLYVPADAIVGRSVAELLPPALVEQVMGSLHRLQRGEPVNPFVYDLPTPLGERSFEARVVRTREDEMAVIARDVTESRALERMKDEFVSTVSHELRTPLTSIRGALALLSAGVVDVRSGQGEELISTALRNAERLGRLINDILDLERANADLVIAARPQKLAPIVRQALTDIQPLATQFQVRFSLRRCDAEACANVDADRLQQVLQNLLSNAAKYGDPKQAIEVELLDIERAWRIQVSNGGPPIPESFRSKLFQRFAMVDGSDRREREGTGLGLAISRALVERMGGTIDYTSSSERTVFFVDLPCWTEPPGDA